MRRRRVRALPRTADLAWAGLVLAWAAAGWAAAPEVDAQSGSPSVVEFDLRVRGELFATATAGAEPVRQPITLDARFEFVERTASELAAGVVQRRYRTARADIDSEGQRKVQQLGADARDVLMRLEGTTPRAYLAEGFLSRDEAALLDIPFDPMLIDGVRPDRPVAQGDSWKLPGDLVAGLLCIDTVESGGLEATLASVDDATAVVQLRGTVVGAADGVPTRIEVTGQATGVVSPANGAWNFDGPIAALEATVSERRESGWVAPGLEVVATIAVKRSPPADSPAETEPVTEGLADPATHRPAGPGRPGMVWHRHRHGRYTSVLDTRWRVVEDGPEGLVLRLSDRGRLMAQCSVLPLPRVAADAAPAEQTVRDDVRRSLGDQFGLVAESEAATREDGTRIVRVVAEGAADGRPFRWIHYVLTDPAGHRVAVTFMHEPAVVDRFAAADRELVAGLVVLPDTPTRQAVGPAAGPR